MTNNKIKEIFVYDLEATCGLPEGTQSEIIQLGYCFLNLKTKAITNCKSIIVKPQYTSITKFCTDLTGITQEQVNKGINFKQLISHLMDLKLKYRMCVCFGHDHLFIQNECISKNVEYPFSVSNLINLCNLIKLRKKTEKGISLINALKENNLEFEGIQHNAMYDAYNTARLFSKYF